MMLVGGVLNANTVLQPQFMQQLLGYTATTAGLALTAGGVALLVDDAAGRLRHRQNLRAHPRRLSDSSCSSSRSAIAAEVTTLQMSFAQASWLRVVQMLPLPFCFISITTAAYVGMPKEESNQVAGLINFARNIGGSILIAITNAAGHQSGDVASTAPTKRHDVGLDRLSSSMSTRSPAFSAMPSAIRTATAWLWPSIYNQLNQQAQMQGYQDVYMELSWMSTILIVLAFLLSKNRPGQGAGGGAMH